MDYRDRLRKLLTKLGFHVRLVGRLPSRLASPLTPLFPITARSLLRNKKKIVKIWKNLFARIGRISSSKPHGWAWLNATQRLYDLKIRAHLEQLKKQR